MFPPSEREVRAPREFLACENTVFSGRDDVKDERFIIHEEMSEGKEDIVYE